MAHPENQPEGADLTEEMKQKVAAAVNKELNDIERTFVERSIKHMDNLVLIAPAIARATRAVYDAFLAKGFDENRAFALSMEFVKGSRITGY